LHLYVCSRLIVSDCRAVAVPRVCEICGVTGLAQQFKRIAHGRMGAYSASRRCAGVCFVLACGVQLAQAADACSADDACHFGSCEQKTVVVQFLTQNAATVACTHPYVKVALAYMHRDSEKYTHQLALRCGKPDAIRPVCETRIAKTALDTILVVVFGTVCVFTVAKDLRTAWAGA